MSKKQTLETLGFKGILAPQTGLEPVTLRLTAACSNVRLVYIPERLVSDILIFSLFSPVDKSVFYTAESSEISCHCSQNCL